MIDGKQIVAVLSTQITDEGQAEIVNIAGHRVGEWLADADNCIGMWARLCGAEKISARGRKGWGRIAAPLGWVEIGRDGNAMLYEKVI